MSKQYQCTSKPSINKVRQRLAKEFQRTHLGIVCPNCWRRNKVRSEMLWRCSFCHWREPPHREERKPKKKKRRKK